MDRHGTELRELADRVSDGLDVVLPWNPADAGVTVIVTDARTGDAFAFNPDRRRALEAFYHPSPEFPRERSATRRRRRPKHSRGGVT